MNALFRRLFLAALLAGAPALAMAQSDDAPADEAEAAASVEAADDKGDEDEAVATAPEVEEPEAEEDEWAAKLRQRHHEGDVALGVCGGRMTALMWFYQSSVADGRDDLQPAYDAIRESRTVLKQEAERRAVDDGIATSVSVMNEQSAELWKALIEASETPEKFQETHDELFASVQECLSLFFRRGVRKADADAEEAETGVDAEAETGEVDGKAD